MRVAIHQPNYMPWLGYFEKIAACDVFVLLDGVQYIRQGLTRRTKIRDGRAGDGAALLSVPLQSHPQFTKIADLKIHPGDEWRAHHLNKIREVYRRAPNFAETFDWLEPLIAGNHAEDLAALNVALIKATCAALKIETPMVLSSSIATTQSGSALMAELTRAVGGSHYYSGGGAGGYTNANDFAGLDVSFQDMFSYCAANPYRQTQGSAFVNGLSVIDALFNLGARATRDYIDRYPAWKSRAGEPLAFAGARDLSIRRASLAREPLGLGFA